MSFSKSGSKSSLGHMAKERWVFDEEVTAMFTDMLSRSIPQYDVMRRSVLDLSVPYLRQLPGTYVVDLGCSRGDGLAPFIDMFAERNKYFGVDVSAPMLAAARSRFAEDIDRGLVTIADLDIGATSPGVSAGLTLCILTLQFIPVEHRSKVLADAYRHTVPGGILILVEKILGSSEILDSHMTRIYYEYKQSVGYSKEEIERKRLSLKGVLEPVSAKHNERLLADAGFREVDCFWRWMTFAGWLAVK